MSIVTQEPRLLPRRRRRRAAAQNYLNVTDGRAVVAA